MEIKLTSGDRLTIPEGCKAEINGNEIVIEQKHEYKDGDMLTSIYDDKVTLIFKCYHEDGSERGISHFNTDTNSLKEFDNECWDMDSLRPSTDEEKQHLFDKMKEQGLRWNAEEKRVENIRWRAKNNGIYYFINELCEVNSLTDTNINYDDKLYIYGNYFRTREQAKQAAEAVRETLIEFHEEND